LKLKAQSLKLKALLVGYLLTVVGLFLYSFTQIDLGLTLSEASIWQSAEKFFKNIGYFQRPLSAYFFTGIVISLFFFYLTFLILAYKQKIKKSTAWFLIISTALILNFSYNAFSYDLFNYIFDAKIVTFYQQNPYVHKALDFPGDPMLSFMHWTHRVYPYGPIWLGLTVPLSFVGFQIFLPTFFLFKTLSTLSFLATAFFIGKILRKFSAKDEIFGVIFFALNPLVIIESLVSSHNDIITMFFLTISIYLLMVNKYIRSILLLILSIGIKFTSIFVIPIYLFVYFFRKIRKNPNFDLIFSLLAISMIVPIVAASYRTNYQPWYLLNILPLIALVAKKYYFFIPAIVFSLLSVFMYLPFIYLGNWNDPVPRILNWMIVAAVILSCIGVLSLFLKKVIK
jgi:hypothetical protein